MQKLNKIDNSTQKSIYFWYLEAYKEEWVKRESHTIQSFISIVSIVSGIHTFFLRRLHVIIQEPWKVHEWLYFHFIFNVSSSQILYNFLNKGWVGSSKVFQFNSPITMKNPIALLTFKYFKILLVLRMFSVCDFLVKIIS